MMEEQITVNTHTHIDMDIDSPRREQGQKKKTNLSRREVVVGNGKREKAKGR